MVIMDVPTCRRADMPTYTCRRADMPTHEHHKLITKLLLIIFCGELFSKMAEIGGGLCILARKEFLARIEI